MKTKLPRADSGPHFSREVRALLRSIRMLPEKNRDFVMGDMLRHGTAGQRRAVSSYVGAVLST